MSEPAGPATARFRFYAELNDFLRPHHRRRAVAYRFGEAPAVKDPIESFGVPHSEVELVVVNGRSVGFDYRLAAGDRVAVYPVFEAIDVSPVLRLRPRPLRRTAFVVDVNLGKLARRLRMLGFDTAYRNDYEDAEVVRVSLAEHRIILTRDRRLLFHRAVTHGLWIRSTEVDRQLIEVLDRLDLHRSVNPFHRCMDCNGEVEPVAREHVEGSLMPQTRRYYDEFYRCAHCAKVYWPGPHFEHMRSTLARLGIHHDR